MSFVLGMRSFYSEKNNMIMEVLVVIKKYPVLFCFILLTLLLFFSGAFSDTVRISQIDNSFLLINQKVKVYLGVTDQKGSPIKNLEKDNFTLYEFDKQREILSFERGININQGINLLLVIDNSGSMYWDGSGKIKNSADEKIWRITHAKDAVSSLLNEIKNPLDRVSLISFNVKLDSKVKMTNEKVEIARVLKNIKRPEAEEAYTELYETLYQSVDYLRAFRGRKVIILLSDGQNFPLEENPHFPTRYGMDGAVEYAQQEGTSVFTIGLSRKADRKNLKRIAEETGGAYFSVYDPELLRNLYKLIREQILNEYLVTYSAGMAPAEKTPVKVIYRNDEAQDEAERFYFSGTIFGFGQEKINYLIFILIPVSLGLLWVLSLIKFEQKKETPNLTVRTSAGRKTIVHSFPVTSVESEMTIGGSGHSDLTITGDTRIKMNEAKIVQKKGAYTITGVKGPIIVNNKSVRTKVLRSGDLIQVGNTTVVFDKGVTRTVNKESNPGPPV